MNKEELYKAILEQIRNKLSLAVDAVKMAHESATHEENIAECKYDTKGLEASYLVQGQAKRVEELESALAAFNSMDIYPVEKVMLNALVKLEDQRGKEEFMFIAPASGGLKVNFDDKEILVMTPISPLGKSLLGKSVGDEISVSIGRKHKEYKLLSVS
ncbi:MAG: GreA/GreB family elongation factor [Lentisphaeraceae bacterium]|nr:GreA/GreB family elongation factor [Lentisphaeraceae bacterium]